jgi:hypothetical protein
LKIKTIINLSDSREEASDQSKNLTFYYLSNNMPVSLLALIKKLKTKLWILEAIAKILSGDFSATQAGPVYL